jgi:hypothetical protein
MREEYQEIEGAVPYSPGIWAEIRAPQARPAHYAIVISNARGDVFTPRCRCGWDGVTYRAGWPPVAERVFHVKRQAQREADAHNGVS